MFLFDWFQQLFSRRSLPQARRKPERPPTRPGLEALEDRTVPAPLMVTSIADDGGAGELRQVIAAAPRGSVIQFDPTKIAADSTIQLTSQITINDKDLTIDGQKLGLSISGNNVCRIFNITGDSNVEIDNLNLENGKPTPTDLGNGGAISDIAGKLTLTNDGFFSNTARDANGRGSGGAVFTASTFNGPLVVTGCFFSDNSAGTQGGAIYTEGAAGGGNVQLNNSTFIENTSTYEGGAVAAIMGKGSLAIANCTFNFNKATMADGGVGGAVYSELPLTDSGSSYYKNTAGFEGGAIAYLPNTVNLASNLSLSNITFQINQAPLGGAVYLQVGTNRVAVNETISGCLFNANKATAGNTSAGGGLCAKQTTDRGGSARLSVINSTFYQNTSAQIGGAIAVYANAGGLDNANTTNMTDLTVNQNQAGVSGGGLYVDPNSSPGSVPQLDNNLIAGNSLNNGATKGVDISGEVVTNSFNLVGNGSGATVRNNDGNWQVKDIVGTPATPQAPGLDPKGLQKNGGPTQTIALITAGANQSKAYRSGDPNLPSPVDQRGYKRPAMNPSIGAYDPDGVGGGGAQGQTPTSTYLASSVSPSYPGQAVLLTATVSGSGGIPTGTVTFTDGDMVLGTAPVDASGQASLTTAAFSPGSNALGAAYSGDETYAGSSASLTQMVNPIPTATYLTSSASPALPGQAVTLTAAVAGGDGGIPTGTVTFQSGTTPLGSGTLDANGNATFTTSSLPPGDDTITAIYNGDRNYLSSSGTFTQLISQEVSSSLTLSTSANPSTFGQAVTLTAVVSGSSGTPTGSVTFQTGDTVLGVVSLDGTGTATLTTTALPSGQQTIAATYSGDATYNTSTASLAQMVVSGTVTTVTSSASPALPGLAVTLTAAVAGDDGGIPTGTVTFQDGSTVLGTGTLDANGNAAFTTSALALGSHTITAGYGGDSNYTSSSGTFTQVISQEVSSSLYLSSSANPSTAGQAVTFSANVSGNSGTPTGSVTFQAGDVVLGTVSLDAYGNATLTTSTLPAGSNPITATYNGDATYNSSTASLTQTVQLAATSTYLSSSLNPSQPGQAVALTAQVSADSGTPTGTVTFYCGATILGTANLALVDGYYNQATLTTSALPSGDDALTALYNGDGTFAGSSGAMTQTVQQGGASVYLSSSVSPSYPGQSVTFTAEVSAPGYGSLTPTGTVTFYDGSTALATVPLAWVNNSNESTFTTSVLSLGSHTITAVYNGDAAFMSSSMSLTQTLSQESSSTYLSSSSSSVPLGQPVTFEAFVSGGGPTPTGTVTIYDGSTALDTVPLDGSGQAEFTTAQLTSGTHTINAVYSGDTVYTGSSMSIQETID